VSIRKRIFGIYDAETGTYVLLYLVILVKTLELFLLYLMAHLGMIVKGKLQR
jgi:hypothetical protein